MRQASFKVVRQENESSVFWSIYVPAYLNPAGKAGKMYFSTRAEAETKRGELDGIKVESVIRIGDL